MRTKPFLINHLIGLLPLFICLIFQSRNFAQNQGQLSNPNFESKIKSIFPASPTAAGLGKYGNTPVNLSTGSAGITVPIYNLQSRDISMNISLSYNSGGNKVESIASWVGLGWNLEVGGVINRVVQGLPDDTYNGYMTNQPRSIDFIIDNLSNPLIQSEINDYLRMAGAGKYDLEPDLYSFNFMGHSGKFYYDKKNNRFNFLPLKNYKIAYTSSGDFIITADDGFRFYFEAKEYTTTSGSICTSVFLGSNPGNSVTTVSSWFLTKIENSTKTEIIYLNYTDYVSSNETNFSQTKYILKSHYGSYAINTTPPNYSQITCNNGIVINGKRLASIVSSAGKIQFNTFDFDRCDVQGERALHKVEVFDPKNNKIKTFEFSYGYFGGPDNIANCQYSFATRSYYLRLNSVAELSNDATPKKLLIEFEYSQTPIPSLGRYSFAQDFWGYYNGAESNSDLVPPAFINDPALTDWSVTVPGANRLVNPSFSQFGILTKN